MAKNICNKYPDNKKVKIHILMIRMYFLSNSFVIDIKADERWRCRVFLGENDDARCTQREYKK